MLGDELLDLAPRDIGCLPATDVARLRLLRARLDGGFDRVVWLDADVLVFAPERVTVPSTFAVCEEVWVTPGRTLHLVCNAALVAVQGDDRLDEVLAETERPPRRRGCRPRGASELDRTEGERSEPE